MNSRELGLVLAQQLLDVDDLHYGLWDDDLPLSLANLGAAQQRYSDLLLDLVGRRTAGLREARILDVGCGTGHLLQQLCARGYRVDAVNPSAALNRLVRERLATLGNHDTQLLETGFESIPAAHRQHQYDVVLFSESFQYIPLPGVFEVLPGLLAPAGEAVICDFFRTSAHGQGGAGDRSFGGGHPLAEFYRRLGEAGFSIVLDEDLTARVSPGIALLDDWLRKRLVPATATLDSWLLERHPFKTRMLKWLLRKQLARLHYKYLAGYRSQAVFERYKSYRLVVLKQTGMAE